MNGAGRRNMNHVASLSVIPMLLGCVGPAAAQDQQSKKSETAVTIAAPASEAKVGEPFQLKLSLTNISDHGITLAIPGLVDGPVYKKVLFRVMDIEVRGAGGNPVAETEYGKTIHGRSRQAPPPPPPAPPNSPPRPGPEAPKGFGIYLVPGDSISEQSDLSREFDLSRPGTYTVQASSGIHDPATGKPLTSNTVTFTITR
jgi:hypothetical protein